MIVDCFPFFAKYHTEILELRIKFLEPYVDKFIVVESDKTHVGDDVELKFTEIAAICNLPLEKIIYVPHKIPEITVKDIRPIDVINTPEKNRQDYDSLKRRVRERLQKDAITTPLHQFDDDTVFICSDADEIIDPTNLDFIVSMCKEKQGCIFKIPMVHLQGRADLRVHIKGQKGPKVNNKAMFVATKTQLQRATPTQIRSNSFNPFPIKYLYKDGKMLQDMGWHLSWMGRTEERIEKAMSCAHSYDKFNWLKKGSVSYADPNFREFIENHKIIELNDAPGGNSNHILRRYPIQKLPKIITETQKFKNFFLPDVDLNDKTFTFNHCKCHWCQNLKFPLMYDLDGERYWFEVPRSCSVTIKESHPKRRQIFRETKEYSQIMERQTPLIVFTDPLQRFISLINVYLVKGNRYYHYGRDIFEFIGKDIEKCSLEEKVDLFFKNLHKVTSKHQVHHFHPQSYFADTKNFDRFTVVRREDVNDHFGITSVMNRTKKQIMMEHFSPEQIEFLKSIYQCDYEFFEKYG